MSLRPSWEREVKASGLRERRFPTIRTSLSGAYGNIWNDGQATCRGCRKNHYHASLNPNAQFHNILTVEQVLKSSCVADPLKLLDCSPISDGAAALVITSAKGIRIAASVATDSLGLAQRQEFIDFDATHAAATRIFTGGG